MSIMKWKRGGGNTGWVKVQGRRRGGGVKMRAKGECGEGETAVCQLPAGPRDLGIAWPNLGKR